MTRISGVCILASRCCGERYAHPRYSSMNFSASAYWTDGWREDSLMTNDEGLRRCKCGQFVLLRDMIEIGTAESSELPYMDRLPEASLPECIANASSKEMEVAARLGYWRHLNHEYRERYRLHRSTEEAATEAAWVMANPDRITWRDKLLLRKPPTYSRPKGSPNTYPAFEATEEQLHNMKYLCEAIFDLHAESHGGYTLELTELYREQSRFDEAESMFSSIDGEEAGVAGRMIAKMLKEKDPAPIRYRA